MSSPVTTSRRHPHASSRAVVNTQVLRTFVGQIAISKPKIEFPGMLASVFQTSFVFKVVDSRTPWRCSIFCSPIRTCTVVDRLQHPRDSTSTNGITTDSSSTTPWTREDLFVLKATMSISEPQAHQPHSHIRQPSPQLSISLACMP